MTNPTLGGYDAAWAPGSPPSDDQVVMGYGGGDTPNVWSLADWNGQHARFRIPIWTRDNPAGRDGAAEAREFLAYLDSVGAPHGILVVLDYEMAVDAKFVTDFDGVMVAAGNKVALYGSKSTLFQNPKPSGGYFPADLTGSAHLYPGTLLTQWAFEQNWDDDTVSAAAVLWDTQAAADPPAKATRRNDMHVDLPYNKPVVFTNPAAALGGTSTMLLASDFGDATVRVAIYSFKAGAWTVTEHTVSAKGGAVSISMPPDTNKVSLILQTDGVPVGLDVLA
jgi:hypothetical protein